MVSFPKNKEIFEDEQVLGTKRKMMDKMRWQSLFQSVGDACKFAAGPIYGGAVVSFVGIIAGTATMGMTVPIALFAVASTLLITGVASSYASSRIWQSSQFDNLEINAKSTADHLVEKIKENNLCLTEHPQNERSDGKSWVEATCKNNQQGAAVENHAR